MGRGQPLSQVGQSLPGYLPPCEEQPLCLHSQLPAPSPNPRAFPLCIFSLSFYLLGYSPHHLFQVSLSGLFISVWRPEPFGRQVLGGVTTISQVALGHELSAEASM